MIQKRFYYKPKLMRSLVALGAAVLVMLLLMIVPGCGRHHGSGRAVAVTSVPEAALAEELLGGTADVVTVIPSNGDPESFEPSVNTLTDLEDCSAYFTLAGGGFEQKLVTQLSENFPNITVSDITAGIEKIYGTHSHGDDGDVHGLPDPHYFSSVKNIRVILRNLSEGLAGTFPDSAAFIARNAELVDSELADLHDSISGIVKPAYARSFVVFHPSLSYFARDYGLRQIALTDEGKETSPKEFRKRLDAAALSNPTVLLYEAGTDAARAKETARTLGIPAVEFSLRDADFRDNLLKIARAVADGARRPIVTPPTGEDARNDDEAGD